MTDALCAVDGCGKKTHNGNYCSMHAERLRKHGDVAKGAFRPRGRCTVSCCDRPHSANGYCVKHNKRFKKYGDPLGGSTDWGAARDWLRNIAAHYTGDDCLVYPFYRNASGYGWIKYEGKHAGAHVVVLRLTQGAAASPDHECRHKCGNGHLGCCNPKHLEWGTRTENVGDAFTHGTAVVAHPGWGEAHIRAKFSDADIESVRALLAAGTRQVDIARRTGMSQAHVSRIKLGSSRVNGTLPPSWHPVGAGRGAPPMAMMSSGPRQ